MNSPTMRVVSNVKYLNYRVYSVIAAIDKESKIMREDCEHVGHCQRRKLISTITKKWALLIINAIGYGGTLRFNELMDMLLDISPKALSDTLKELEEECLVKRESFAEIPPRVEYTLTRDGIGLRDATIPLLKWIEARSDRNKECNPTCQRIPARVYKYAAINENNDMASNGDTVPLH